MTSEPPPSLPAKLGNYELLCERSGTGAAPQWVARASSDTGDSPRLLSILRVPKEIATKAEDVGALLSEARLSMGLQHPNVVAVVAVGTEGGEPFVVSPHHEGETLAALLTAAGAPGLSLPLALRIGLDMFEALAAACVEVPAVVHGEISPAQILVGADGIVRIGGYGSARTLASLAQEQATDLYRLAYASPEHALALHGTPLNGATDVFSSAVVLWELIAQQPLFAAKTATAILQKVTTRSVPPLSSLGLGAVPTALDAALQGALDRDPRRRPAPAEVVAVLQAIGSSEIATRSQVAAQVEALVGPAIAARAIEVGAALRRPKQKGEPSKPLPKLSLRPRKTTLVGISSPVAAPEPTLSPASDDADDCLIELAPDDEPVAEREPNVSSPTAGVPPTVSAPPPPMRSAPPPPMRSAPPPPMRSAPPPPMRSAPPPPMRSAPPPPPMRSAPPPPPGLSKTPVPLAAPVRAPPPPLAKPATAGPPRPPLARPLPSPLPPPAKPQVAPPPLGAPTAPATAVASAPESLPDLPASGLKLPVAPLGSAIAAPTPPPSDSVDGPLTTPEPIRPRRGLRPAKPTEEADRKAAVYTARSFGDSVKPVPAEPKVVIGEAIAKAATPAPPVAHAVAVAPGRRVGSYEILLPWTREGLWAARATDAVEMFVIEAANGPCTWSPEVRQAFAEAAELAGRIRQRNIIPVVDSGEDRGVPFRVLPWFEGVDLTTLVKAARSAGGVPVRIVLRIASQICAGLEALHTVRGEDNIPLLSVHGEVSPRNVIVAPNGGVKITPPRFTTGFGDDQSDASYWAPEQVASLPADARSDVFSLGVVLYVLTVGLHPFQGETSDQTIENIAHHDPVPLRALLPSTPVDLEAIVRRALLKDAADRFPTAAEVRSALDRCSASLGSATKAEVAAFVEQVLGTTLAKRAKRLRAATTPAEVVPPVEGVVEERAELVLGREAASAGEALSAVETRPRLYSDPMTGGFHRPVRGVFGVAAATAFGVVAIGAVVLSLSTKRAPSPPEPATAAATPVTPLPDSPTPTPLATAAPVTASPVGTPAVVVDAPTGATSTRGVVPVTMTKHVPSVIKLEGAWSVAKAAAAKSPTETTPKAPASPPPEMKASPPEFADTASAPVERARPAVAPEIAAPLTPEASSPPRAASRRAPASKSSKAPVAPKKFEPTGI